MRPEGRTDAVPAGDEVTGEDERSAEDAGTREDVAKAGVAGPAGVARYVAGPAEPLQEVVDEVFILSVCGVKLLHQKGIFIVQNL
jgi:hypothetical protein